MSKVFNAKRNSIEVTYQFLDATEVSIRVYELSTKDQVGLIKKESSEIDNSIKNLKESIRLRLRDTEKTIVEKIVTEQYENGDLAGFAKALSELLIEAKEGKLQDS